MMDIPHPSISVLNDICQQERLFPFRPTKSLSVHSKQREQFTTTYFMAQQEFVPNGTFSALFYDHHYELDAPR